MDGAGKTTRGYLETNDPDRVAALRSLRETLTWLGDDVHYIDNEVDSHVEMCTITKAFDNSKALVANKIKGYPGVRMISNLYSTKARTAKIHGMVEFKDIKHKVLDSIRNPVAPKIVTEKNAPVQEMFIPKKDIRHLHDLIPVATHTDDDGPPIFGAGVHFFFGDKWVPNGGSQISMYRMSFREDQPYASINMVPGGGGDVICSRHPKGTRIPCTVNICPPVGAELVAVSTLNPVIFPYNTDKIGLAGAIQGSPVELVKAKTVDAYAMAQAEWCLEGYVIEGQQVWETAEAEKLGKQGVAPLHPEWARAMGHAYRTPRAFELTAITRRGDNPIVYTPHFGAFWYEAPFMCAAVYEMCERMAPGFVIDVASWLGLTLWGGLVIQVRKRRRSDEGLQRNILSAVMGVFRGLRLVVVVDDDIDPWQPEDVVWAIESRASPARDYVIFNEYSRGQAFQPSEYKIGQISVSDGGMGIDATTPLGDERFRRAHYPVERMDFKKWFSEDDIGKLKAMQDPYFRWLGEKGFG